MIGGWLFGVPGIAAGGLIGSIISAVVGAVILIANLLAIVFLVIFIDCPMAFVQDVHSNTSRAANSDNNCESGNLCADLDTVRRQGF